MSAKLFALLRDDWRANYGNTKGRFIVSTYRLSNYFAERRGNFVLALLGLPVVAFYKFFVNWLMGVEIDSHVSSGPGLRVFHGQGLVVNATAKLGAHVTLRHTTTIGNKREGGACPKIGDHVDIGAHSVVLGGITVGDGAVIGAGSVVVRDVAADEIVVGNPARGIGKRRDQ